MSLLHKKATIGLIALSNTPSYHMKETFEALENVLNEMELKVKWAENFYNPQMTDQEKAQDLMKFYQQDEIKAIFDVSGGDLANGVLPYLDYEVIESHYKPFFGYSDLSVIVNGLYAQTNQTTYLYQIRHLVGAYAAQQQQWFKDSLLNDKDSLFMPPFEWIQGDDMQGEVVGGNIRCFLKLAGTPYFPIVKNKILLLESYSGDVFKMTTYLNQFKQMGVFDQIQGLILGQFTEMEQKEYVPDMVTLVQKIIDRPDLPIVKTNQIGHGADSKCAIIGEVLTLMKEV